MTTETINAQEPTLFGLPVEVSLKISDTETIYVTHALGWDGKNITLDEAVVRRSINAAYAEGFGLPRPKG